MMLAVPWHALATEFKSPLTGGLAVWMEQALGSSWQRLFLHHLGSDVAPVLSPTLGHS